MSFLLLGILNSQAAGGAVAYWLSTLGGASDDEGYGVAMDSADNSYAVGRTESAGNGGNDFLLVKRDVAGTIQWQRVLGAIGTEVGNSVAIDSSDNVYVFGQTNTQGAGVEDFLLAKYNSSGTIQWQRVLGTSSNETGNSVAIDSSGNVYAFGFSRGAGLGYNDFLLAKYNSSGTIQWQRVLGGGGNDYGQSVAIDSADNVYVLGQTQSTGAGSDDFLLAKYNSSGTIQWQRVLGGASYDLGYSVAIDSNDDVYAFGRTGSAGAGSADFLLAKYNSSGTIQWQRVLGGTGGEEGYSIAIDSSDNVYAFGNTSSAGEGSNDFLIAKYNSSGTIQWQRVLGASGNELGESVTIDSNDNVYVLGRTNSTGAGLYDFFLAKLPNDGSLTGTYVLNGVDVVYAASSLTGATSSLTSATSSLTSATSSLTAATSTLTSASASLTGYFVEIGA
jgi:uncharacterized delta-60 repeat protein